RAFLLRRPRTPGWASARRQWYRSRSLFEPGIGHEVVVHSQQGPVVEHDRVVHARNGVFSPPLIIDPPAILDRGDAAWGKAPLAPDRDDSPLGVGLHAQRTGRVQRPQI